MRGKEQAENLDGVDMRITPACAGKSRRKSLNNEISGDHPRVCGEKDARNLKFKGE